MTSSSAARRSTDDMAQAGRQRLLRRAPWVLGGLMLLVLSALPESVAALTVVATIPAGAGPHAVAVLPATNRVYVANSGGTTVSLIDGNTNTALGTTLTVGAGPQGLDVNPTTNRLYVGSFDAGTVAVFDTTSNALLATISGLKVNPSDGPVDVKVNAVTNKIYVGRTVHAGVINVIDGVTNAVSAIPVGSHGVTLDVNSVTNRIYVANFFSNTVSVIDGATNTTVATVAGLSSPVGVAVNETTNRIYVGNAAAGTVSVISGATNAIVATIAVGSDPTRIAVDEAANRVYVARRGGNAVAVVDGAAGTLSETVAVGLAPHGLAVSPVNGRVYVANLNSNSVSVIGQSDTTPPTLSPMVTPNPVVLGGTATASPGASDAQSGIASASCQPVVTTSVGNKSLTCMATDNAGNTASATANYVVTFGVCALYDQTKAHKSGSTVPIKFQLCNASGVSVSAATVVVTATGLVRVDSVASAVVEDAGSANPDSNFRFDATLGSGGGYIYNLSTRGLDAGTWKITFTAAGDPVTHSLQFDVR